MDTQHPVINSTIREPEFPLGATVIYALLGRCSVTGVESRQMGNEVIQFYKLEKQKSALSRSTRQEPAIWVPVSNAISRGLRSPMPAEKSEEAMRILSNREHYFQASEPWSSVQPKLEAVVRSEGGIGLAKVLSYLHVLRKRQVVPSTEVTRMFDTVYKLLVRELADALNLTPREIDERLTKGLRQKLLPDH